MSAKKGVSIKGANDDDALAPYYAIKTHITLRRLRPLYSHSLRFFADRYQFE